MKLMFQMTVNGGYGAYRHSCLMLGADLGLLIIASFIHDKRVDILITPK